MEDYTKLLLIPVLPFLGFLLNGLLGNRMGPRFVSWVGCLAPLGAFYVTVTAFSGDLTQSEYLRYHAWDWISVGDFKAPFALLFDHLSACMCLVITGVGSLIHLYSTGYMKGDPSYARFFAYLNLFTAFMLILVLGDNLLLLFVGWEGVGLCSYLLIGFWHKDAVNCDAGRKAFLFNRVGDFGFLIGTFLIYKVFHTIDTREVVANVAKLAAESTLVLWPGWDALAKNFGLFVGGFVVFVAGSAYVLTGFSARGVLRFGLPIIAVGVALAFAVRGDFSLSAGTVITLLLFVGATGKSAQIPLYPWLPDAMAGPTPVSALIHAATMVTSGVYLCCRLAPLFSASPTTMSVVAGIGACTALLAALIALSQNDIKKVLAYSTVSQLGYMFYAVGVGAFGAAFFHVVTHAFFKALLFLGSGSVIHAMHHEQDMRKMGGLRKQLPFTHAMFIIGTAAIAGVPVFAGFFSKDEILFNGMLNAFHSHGEGHHVPGSQLFWFMAFATAGLTAFYMLRMVALTFWGKSRVEESVVDHVHEPGGWMPTVLFVLAVLSIVGGFMNVPDLAPFNWVTEPGRLSHFLGLHVVHEGANIHTLEYIGMALSVGIGLLGLAAAWYLYGPGAAKLQSWVDGRPGAMLTQWSRDKFKVDELYHMVVIAPFQVLSWLMWALVDRILIDGLLVHGSAFVVRSTGEFFRRMQSGFIPAYLLTFGCGALVLIFIMMNLLKGHG